MDIILVLLLFAMFFSLFVKRLISKYILYTVILFVPFALFFIKGGETFAVYLSVMVFIFLNIFDFREKNTIYVFSLLKYIPLAFILVFLLRHSDKTPVTNNLQEPDNVIYILITSVTIFVTVIISILSISRIKGGKVVD